MKRIAILLAISSVFLTACATTRWVRTPVAKEGDFVVTLEQLQDKGAVVPQQYAQPFKIQPKALAKIMRDLKYSEKSGLLGKKETSPVFQEVEIDRLAPVLAGALANADATQRVRFTSYNRGKALIFSVSRETEGVMFVKPENRLNIAFNYINAEIEPDSVNTLPPNFSKMDPLRIRATSTILLPDPDYATLHVTDDDQTAPMWVVIDLDKLDQILSKAPAMPAAEQQTTAPEPQPTVAPAAPSGNALQKDIKAKLQYLKGLLDDGLISEEDYNAKKAELLEKIK